MLTRKFSGRIFPINPKYDSIHGVDAYQSVRDLPETPDCVLICVNAGLVPSLLREAAEAGARSAVIYASGFQETGDDGATLQAEIAEISKNFEMPFCGPNCIGPVNFVTGFGGFSANLPDDYTPGNVSAVCQSGSVAIALLNSGRGLHFRYLISSGNEASVSVEDYFEYLLEDEGTDVIIGFIESFKNIPKLRVVAQRAREVGKPLIVLKVGRTEFAQRTVLSHTGALAGEDAILDALFLQDSIVRSQDLNELLEAATLFGQIKPPPGNRVGMVAISGGEIGMLSDLCADIGIDLPELDETTANKLRDTLPPYSPIANPVDAWGNGDLGNTFQRCIEAVGTDIGYDSVVVCLDVQSGMNDKQANYYSIAANSIVEAAKTFEKPLVVFSNLGSGVHSKIAGILSEASIPVLQGTISSLNAIQQWIHFRKKSEPEQTLEETAQHEYELLDFSGHPMLSEQNAKGLLREWGIPVNKTLHATTFLEAKGKAEDIGYPVVLKIDSLDIPHKYKAGCVAINIHNSTELEEKYDEIMANADAAFPSAEIEGVTVQEMIHSVDGVEALAGITMDPQCGPTIVFGVGGVQAEALNDTSMRLVPLSANDAHAMIDAIRARALFAGADRDALAKVLVTLSQLAVAYEDQITQLDINPLLVLPEGEGVVALDALVLARDSEQ